MIFGAVVHVGDDKIVGQTRFHVFVAPVNAVKSSKFNIQLIFLRIAQIVGQGHIAPLDDKCLLRALGGIFMVETVDIVIVDVDRGLVHHVKLDGAIANLCNKIGAAHFSREERGTSVL